MELEPEFLNIGGSAEAPGECGEQFLVEFAPAVVIDIEIQVAYGRRDKRKSAWVESSWGEVAESDR